MRLLEVRNLRVNVGRKEILHGVNLDIGRNEIHVLMGPNACGKTTLALTIVGHPIYKIVKGAVFFNGENIAKKEISERARLGIALAYQNPPEVRGVKLRDMIRLIAGKDPWNPLVEPKENVATEFLERVGLDPSSFLTRDLNIGFSGGERKRSELAQVFAMKPRLMILDEPDSGVDIDSLRLIGEEVSKVVDELGSSVLVITHHRHILRYLRPDIAHIMYDGRIVDSGEPGRLIPKIEGKGYKGYIRELGLEGG